MRPVLFGAIILGAAVAAVLTEISLFRMFSPPDTESAILGGLWLASPYFAACGMALLFRRRNAALIVLTITLLVVGSVGVSMLNASAVQHEASQKEVENAVRPGEDPSRGPAAMRKTGAEVGGMIGGLFSILICVVLPPVQIIALIIPSTIAFAISSAGQRGPKREGENQAPEAE